MRDILNTKILLSGATIIAAAAIVIGATYAFFSDTETSAGNTLAGGELDLLIDNESYYNGEVSAETTWGLDDLEGHLFFDFHDVKPGDYGEDTISIHVNDNDAWACMDTVLTSDDENEATELELAELDTADDENNLFDGELGENLNFVFWADDGDNVLEDDETGENIIAEGPASQVLDDLSVTLADSLENLFGDPGDPLEGAQTYYIAKAWCFGELTQEPLGQDGLGADSPTTPANSSGGIACDGSGLNNITQTDNLTVDVAFSATQHRNNPDFTCDEQVTPTLTPTPTPPQIACETEDNIFASGVLVSAQGLRKNGTAVTSDRDDPLDATGIPQHPLALDFDSPVVPDSFFSLGFPHTNNGNIPGSIDLDMGEIFYPNPAGDDLFVYEVTGGTSYPVETAQVYAKLNLGDSWTLLGSVSRDEGVELSGGGLTSARYVRLVEASNIAPFEEIADGFDLDAVKAFCTEVTPQP